MADVVDNAYAAGLFDGEGCVQLYMRSTGRTKNCLRCALSVSGSDPRPLQWLMDRWGGSIKWDHSKSRLSTGRRPLANWVIFSNEAEVFARDIQPYLLVKREQLDLWLEGRAQLRPRGRRKGESSSSSSITDSQREMRQALVDRVKALKVESHHR